MLLPETNWAGNVTFGARHVYRPVSLDELRRVVANSDRIRPLGTAHSFNRIADTAGDQVSVAGLPPTVDIDAERSTVTVAGGLRYGEFAGRLHTAGFALRNLASLPHISVAGAVATGTHGSGQRNGNLTTEVSALRLVTASGDVVDVRRGDADFNGIVVGLGAFGVVTAVTLDLRPTFEISQYVYENLPVAEFVARPDEIMGAGYSVSLFTDWRDERINQVWVKGPRADWSPEPVWLGATQADAPRHPVPGMPTASCTEQLGVPGPWHERLPHFRLEFTPSSGEELQSEFFVPRASAVAAFQSLHDIRDRIAPVLQISEIRAIAADDLWLSPSNGRDSVAFHFTWIKDTEAVRPALAAVEDQLVQHDARPHWGKLFHDLRAHYARHADFQRLRVQYDPSGKFGNDFLDRHLTE